MPSMLVDEVGALSLDDQPSRRPSYRDKLLLNAEVDGVTRRVQPAQPGLAPSATTTGEARVWRPLICVAKVEYLRVGRLYGTQPDAGPEFDDDEGYWDLLDASAATKIATAVTHQRNKTLLTPLQLEKKGARIALKGGGAA
jgi:hypothetical protein